MKGKGNNGMLSVSMFVCDLWQSFEDHSVARNTSGNPANKVHIGIPF